MPYFQGIKTDMPRKITIGDYSTLIQNAPKQGRLPRDT
jgi:hypothetical protein